VSDLEKSLHRTWVQALVEYGYTEIAAIAIDAEISIMTITRGDESEWVDIPSVIWIDIPIYFFDFFQKHKELAEKTLREILKGHIYDSWNRLVENDYLEIQLRVSLIEVEEGWKNVIRREITEPKEPNQGVITEKVFARHGKRPYIYNEMKFGSKSEIKIAQELESRKVLFFPLPLAVRCETQKFYEDHREVDFLICNDGAWGILEIAFHSDRYEKDKEKDAWFKRSGILCIEHYTAEKCFGYPKAVVDEFLEVLSMHRGK
jgi:hypothetical protein